nr:MAG: RNA-dependent RNA polymerase [Wufeng bat picorna-like virus 1]
MDCKARVFRYPLLDRDYELGSKTLRNNAVSRPSFDSVKFFVSPSYSNISKQSEFTDSLLFPLIDSDVKIFKKKMAQLGILSPHTEETFSIWTKKLRESRFPAFINLFSDNLYLSQSASKFIGSDNLLHFLQTHRARRMFLRQHSYWHFHQDLFRVVFPCGLATNSKCRTLEPCPYYCRSFYQNCEWHQGLHDSELSKRRLEFLREFREQRWDLSFWLSLSFDVHCQWNRDHSFTYVERESKSLNFFSQLFHSTQAALLCPECSKEFDSQTSLLEHLREVHSDDETYSKSWLDQVKDTFSNRLDDIISGLEQTGSYLKSHFSTARLYKLKRFIVNVFCSLCILSSSTDLNIALSAITILVTEITAEFPGVIRRVIEALGTSLKQVISRFFPRTQANSTAQQDQVAMDESFVTSFFNLIKAIIGGNMEAGLFKARLQKIKDFSHVLSFANSLAAWIVTFLDHVKYWIDIYFYGMTEKEAKEAHSIVHSGDIENWIKEVQEFEIQINNMSFSSKVPTLISSTENQAKVVNLKRQGETYLCKLNVGTMGGSRLCQLLKLYLSKVEKWYKLFEDTLGKTPPKHEPFMIYLHGDPGVGKTYCVDYIVQALMATRNQKFDKDRDIFTKDRTAKFHDGYRDQFCYLLDDFLQVLSDESNEQEIGFLIDAGSRARYHLNMANVDKKAASYLTSPVIIVTSNTPLVPNLFSSKLQSYAALARRFDMMVEVRRDMNLTSDAKFDTRGLCFLIRRFYLNTDHNNGGEFRPIGSPISWEIFRSICASAFILKEKRQLELDQMEPVPSRSVQNAQQFVENLPSSTSLESLVLGYVKEHAMYDPNSKWVKPTPVLDEHRKPISILRETFEPQISLQFSLSRDSLSRGSFTDEEIPEIDDHSINVETTEQKPATLVEIYQNAISDEDLAKYGEIPIGEVAQATELPPINDLCTTACRRGEASTLANDCFFSTMKQLLKRNETPAMLRVMAHDAWKRLYSDRESPFVPGKMVETDQFAFLADFFQVTICLHWTYQNKVMTSRWLCDGQTKQICHIFHDKDHYTPLFPLENLKEIDHKMMCPAEGCEFTSLGPLAARDLLYHSMEQSRKGQRLRFEHTAAVEALQYQLEVHENPIVRPTQQIKDTVEQIQRNMVFYQPEGSPYCLSELVPSGRIELLDALCTYYKRYDATNFLWNMVSYPTSWVSAQITKLATKVKTATKPIFAPLDSVSTAINDFSKTLESTLSSLKKWAIVGLVIALISTTFYYFINRGRSQVNVESYGPSSSKVTRTKPRKIQRIEAETESEEEKESYGPSASVKTRSKGKKVQMIEASTQFTAIESYGPSSSQVTRKKPRVVQRIEADTPIKYRAMIQLTSERYNLVMEEEDPDVIVELYQRTMKVKDREGYTYTRTRKSKTDKETRKLFESILDEIFEMETSEGKEERKALVESLIGSLPVAEAARDPNLMTLFSSLGPNAFKIVNQNNFLSLRGIFIEGTFGIYPAHLLSGCNLVNSIPCLLSTHTAAEIPFTLTKQNTIVEEHKDIAITDFSSLNIPMKKSIISKFMKETDVFDSCDGYMMVVERSNDGTMRNVWQRSLSAIYPVESTQYTDEAQVRGNKYIYVVGAMKYTGDTQKGECGSLILRTGLKYDRKILGFHTAGSTGSGTGVVLTQEFLRGLVAQFCQSQAVVDTEFYPVDSAEEFFDCIESQDGQSIELPFVQLISDVPSEKRISQPSKTGLMKSPLYGKLIETKSAPSPQIPFVNDEGEEIFPLYKALSKLESPQILFDQKLVEDVAKRMMNEYSASQKLEFYGTKERGKLLDSENILGDPNDEWIKPINMHTSPGYPYVLAGTKSDFIQPEVPKLDPILQSAIKAREDLAKQGRLMPAVVVDVMKDERLPTSKVNQGKVRIFNVCPLDLNFLVRKYFTKFLAQMMNDHVLGEVSVGINVHDEEWQAFHHALIKSGDHWIAGDYSAWDKRCPIQIAMALLPMVEHFYQQFQDYCPDDATVRSVLMEQIFTTTRMAVTGNKSILYQVHQSMPSGIAITAVYNSLINSLLFRVIFAELAMKYGWSRIQAINTYSSHVKFAAYGDDHLARVSTPAFKFFDMVTIQHQMSLHHITYTSATKEEKVEREVSDSEVQYLKRKFRSENGVLHAPMELESVLDILNWVQARTKREAIEAQTSSVLSVLIELSHHPKSVFDYWYLRIFRECNYAGIDCPIVTYEEMLKVRRETDFERDYNQY